MIFSDLECGENLTKTCNNIASILLFLLRSSIEFIKLPSETLEVNRKVSVVIPNEKKSFVVYIWKFNAF